MTRFPWWPATAALGLALAPALAGGPNRYGEAGLAWLAVAALGAAMLGAPLAAWEWRQPRDQPAGRLPRLERMLTRMLAVLFVGASLGPAVASSGLLVVVVLAVLALAVLSRVRVPWLLAGAALPAVALASGGLQLGTVGPWTLLEPRWGGVGDWAPQALVLGAFFAAPGLGVWTRVRDAVPGWRPTVWLPVGAALLAATAAAVHHGVHIERLVTVDLAWLPLAGGLAAAVALLTAVDGDAWPNGLGLACATAWFAGPGLGGLEVFWATTAPGVLALVLLCRGWRAAPDRLLLWAGAAALLGCAAAAWPGLPASAGTAAGVALVWVGLVWGAGTWAVVEHR